MELNASFEAAGWSDEKAETEDEKRDSNEQSFH